MTQTTTTPNQILVSLSEVNKEIDAIGKTQQGYGYKFRGIDDVLNTLSPLFKKHDILTLRRNVRSNRTVRPIIDKNGKPKDYVEVFMQAEYLFKSLKDGSEIITEGFGEGQDTSGGDKASSMATSNAYKYVIFEMFNIATQEQQDSDQVTAKVNAAPETLKAAPKPLPQAAGLAQQANTDASLNPEVKQPTRFRRQVAKTPEVSDDI